jgi:hypothetical protein
MRLIASKIQPKREFEGIPDKVIKSDKNPVLISGSELKHNLFDGWVEWPTYKDFNEVDPVLFKSYNKKDMIYIYSPMHTCSDKMGILTYKVIGVTKKKSDKRVLLIVEDINKSAVFKKIYLEINDNSVFNCGQVFPKTDDNYNIVGIGDEYKGYRNSKWIKLDPNDFKDTFGKIYHK